MLKNILIGFICVMCLVLASGCSTSQESPKEDVSPNTISKPGEVPEYRWLVGRDNPVDETFSERLTGVSSDSILITRQTSRGGSYWMTINIRIDSTFELLGSAFTVTGIYPEDNYITVIESNVRTPR